MPHIKTIEWIDEKVRIVDQTKLPSLLTYIDINKIEEMYEAIKALKVRGAPAIGVAASFGLYLGMRNFPDSGKKKDFITLLSKNADYLASSRPTASNPFWALDRVKDKVMSIEKEASIVEIKTEMLKEAELIREEDNIACRAIGENGWEILKNYENLLTHCNAGALATVEYGTALSPVYVGKEKGKLFHVFIDETRPLLQGARITAFELKEAGIPVTLICDNMAPVVMAQGKIEAVIVGADRIASNGDIANKIGTYGVALAAKAHSIPFYTAAPLSTFDLSIKTGKEIPIEERDKEEILYGFGCNIAPVDIPVFNPAFDITPSELITAIITEKGVIYPPFQKGIERMV